MGFNFPASPTNGQVFGPYTWDGEKWKLTPSSGGISIDSTIINIRQFGAKCDGVYAYSYVTASGTDLSCVAGAAPSTPSAVPQDANFTAADVGKFIVIPGAGPGGVPHTTTIAAVGPLPTQCTLTSAVSTALSSVIKQIFYSSDDNNAIQNAINSLPVTGGTIIVPGLCGHSSTLIAGNGTSVAASTRWGVRFIGTAPPVFQDSNPLLGDAGYPNKAGCGLVYIGPREVTNTAQFCVLGPLRGFEVSNLQFDGREQCKTGLFLYGASFGAIDLLAFTGHAGAALYTASPPFSSAGAGFVSDGNTSHVTSKGLYFRLPNIAGAAGAYFDGSAPMDGDPDPSSDTHSIIIDLLRVHFPQNAVTYGVVFRVCDTVTINNLLMVANSGPNGSPAYAGNSNAIAVYYDHSVGTNALFPADIVLNQVDVAFGITSANQFVSSGGPGAASARNHIIAYLGETNGGSYPRNLLNTLVDLPMKQLVDKDHIGLTTGFALIPLYTPPKAGMWRLTYYMEVVTPATGGTLTFVFGYNSVGAPGKGYASSAIIASSAGNHVEGIVPFMSAAAGLIQYRVDSTATGAFTYNLFLRLERMD